jgi:hypothetical protein
MRMQPLSSARRMRSRLSSSFARRSRYCSYAARLGKSIRASAWFVGPASFVGSQ